MQKSNLHTKKLHEALLEFKMADPCLFPKLIYDPLLDRYFVSYYFSAEYILSRNYQVIKESEVQNG